jgi:plasmid replication initiation protein
MEKASHIKNGKIFDKGKIMQSNRIIKGKQGNLSNREKKLLLQLVLNLNIYDDDLIVQFNGTEICENMSIPLPNKVRDLKKVTSDLQSRIFWLESDNKKDFKRYVLIPTVEYDESKDILKIRLNEDLRKDFIDLHDHFTKYMLQDIMELMGDFSIRIYELAIWNRANIKKGNWSLKYEIDELREMILGLENTKYKTVGNFISAVIKRAIDEINDKTIIDIEFEKIMQGRKCSHIILKCSFKGKEKKSPDPDVVVTSELTIDDMYNNLPVEIQEEIKDRCNKEIPSSGSFHENLKSKNELREKYIIEAWGKIQ